MTDGRGSDLRLLLIDLDMRLRECMKLGLSAAEAYDSAYQEAVATALAAQPVQAQEEAVFRVTVIDDNGTHPPVDVPTPAVDRGLSEAMAELIACKDLKDAAEALHFAGPLSSHGDGWKAEYKRMRSDYIKRQPKAWDAARAALAASAPSQAEPVAPKSPHRPSREWYAEMIKGEPEDLPGAVAAGALFAPSQAGSCQASGGTVGELTQRVRDAQAPRELPEPSVLGWNTGGMCEPDTPIKGYTAAAVRKIVDDALAAQVIPSLGAPPAGRTLTWAQEIAITALRNHLSLADDGAVCREWISTLDAILAASSTTAGERE